jgi:hypothetical protein
LTAVTAERHHPAVQRFPVRIVLAHHRLRADTGKPALVDDSYRIKRLPPYVLAAVTDLKVKARARGEDTIDLEMGNQDRPAPRHVVDKLVEAAKNPRDRPICFGHV